MWMKLENQISNQKDTLQNRSKGFVIILGDIFLYLRGNPGVIYAATEFSYLVAEQFFCKRQGLYLLDMWDMIDTNFSSLPMLFLN